MTQNTQTHSDVFLSWEAPSRPDHERSHRWYLIAGTFCAVMIGYGILAGTWSMAIVFAFIPGLYWLMRNQTHKRHTIGLSLYGIDIDGKRVVWSDWKEFWILSGPDYHELHVSPIKKNKPDLVIQTGSVDPFLVRDAMLEFLPQATDKQERLLDAFIRFCKL